MFNVEVKLYTIWKLYVLSYLIQILYLAMNLHRDRVPRVLEGSNSGIVKLLGVKSSWLLLNIASVSTDNQIFLH